MKLPYCPDCQVQMDNVDDKKRDIEYKCPSCMYCLTYDEVRDGDALWTMDEVDEFNYDRGWLGAGKEEDDIPEGCDACGGDYPNCMDSCPIFD